MVHAVLRAAGPYSLRLTARSATWTARMPAGRWASAQQLSDGTDRRSRVVRARGRGGAIHARARRRHHGVPSSACARPAHRPGRAATPGLRPRRKATVTHAVVRAISGQLIQASKALQIERAIIRAGGEDPPTRESIAQLSPARVTGCGLAGSRATTLARLARTLDLEGMRTRSDALERLGRERGVGPWTVGVVALQGLGRYDAGLVDDLALVKLLASLRRRWPEPGETAELLEPYGEWQGLASVFLLQGFRRGLVRGASMDRARLVRSSARTAA